MSVHAIQSTYIPLWVCSQTCSSNCWWAGLQFPLLDTGRGMDRKHNHTVAAVDKIKAKYEKVYRNKKPQIQRSKPGNRRTFYSREDSDKSSGSCFGFTMQVGIGKGGKVKTKNVFCSRSRAACRGCQYPAGGMMLLLIMSSRHWWKKSGTPLITSQFLHFLCFFKIANKYQQQSM